MKNMKRLIAVMMVLTLALCFVACTQPQQNPGTTTTQAPAPTTSTTTVPSSSTVIETPDYIVYVVDQDGNPVIGAEVILCDEGSCIPGTVEENGAEYYLFKALKGAAKAKITGVPEGYTIDPVEDPDGYTYLAEGETTITLKATKVAE
jgi:hypothetical protein